jgi:hypothetical protein
LHPFNPFDYDQSQRCFLYQNFKRVAVKNYRCNTTTITAVIAFLSISLGTQCWAMLERSSVQPENLHDVQKRAARMAWWRMNEGGPALRSHELSEGVGGPDIVHGIILTAHNQAVAAISPDNYSRVPAAAGAEENVLKQLKYAARLQTSANVNDLLGADAEVKKRRINLYNFYDPEKETVWTLAAKLWKEDLLETLLSNLTTRDKDLAVVKAAQGDGDALQKETMQLLLVNGARKWAAQDLARQLHLRPEVKQRIHDAWTPIVQFRSALANATEGEFLRLLKTPEVIQAIQDDKEHLISMAYDRLRSKNYFPGSAEDKIRERINNNFNTVRCKRDSKQKIKVPAEKEKLPDLSLFNDYKAAKEAGRKDVGNYELARTLQALLIANFGELAKNEICPICMEKILNGPEGITSGEPFDIIVLTCGHYLCSACANKLPKLECPLCREPLKEDFIISRIAPAAEEKKR